MKIEIEREDDGQWIAEVPDLAGVMVYGKTRQEAIAKVEALALRVLADRDEIRKALKETEVEGVIPWEEVKRSLGY